MSSQGRRSVSSTNSPSRAKGKKASEFSSSDSHPRKSFPPQRTGERTVRSLRLCKALTVPETTTVYDACRRMAARKVDALLLTDSNALLCGILTDKDIATRVIASEASLEDTCSKVMTRNPVFVLSDTLAVEALQKMVHGKFRHLPVVENGEVIALLDIAKCLYDAIARLERIAEKEKAIAAAVEGIEKQWGTPASSGSHSSFIETLREQIFKPSLSTIIPENSKVITVSPTDTVLETTKKMLELRISSAIVTVDDKPCGILTSRDILMRVIAQNLPPSSTLVEKVMTTNPECAIVDTPIVDALHTMHDGKFLHLPVLNKDGIVVAIVDVIHITHAAVATASQVGNTANLNNEASNSMIQKFWDSAMALTPNDDDEDSQSDTSLKMVSEGGETGRSTSYNASSTLNAFSFKIQDKKARLHRFTCDTRSLTELVTSIIQRVGNDVDPNNLPQILYEDEEHDKIILASDDDLAAAVDHAKAAGLKGLRLHLDYSGIQEYGRESTSEYVEYTSSEAWASAFSAVAAGAAIIVGLGLLAFLKRSR